MKRIVYHGTNTTFRRFSFKNAPQKIIWFSSDKARIEAGESGARGHSRILKLEVTLENPAGWSEYHRLGLMMSSQGYDGAILPYGTAGAYDGFVFKPTQVKILGVVGEPAKKRRR